MDEYERVCEYLEAEMKRYWPNASSIKARQVDDEELWLIDVTHDTGVIVYRMEIGSDDSWFTFRNPLGGYEAVLTFPFPEWLGDVA